jgi:hypothetical protein
MTDSVDSRFTLQYSSVVMDRIATRGWYIGFLFVSYLSGQWQSPQRLTYHEATSTTFLNQAWCLAAQGDTVHIVWDDDAEGCWEVYTRSSYDGGVSWENVIRLSDSTADSQNGHLAVSTAYVHVVWRDEQHGTGEIYYRRSSDSGLTWGPAARLTQDTSASVLPSITAVDSIIHLVWSDDRDGQSAIFYKRSRDHGMTWEADRRLSSGPLTALFPSVSATSSRVNVVWTAGWEIYHLCSQDTGHTWGSEQRLTVDPAVSWFPSVAVSDTIVHVVWHDQRDGYIDVFYARSVDGGMSWQDDTNLTANDANSNIPCLAAADSMVHIAWYDNRDGNYEIYYKRSRDHGMTWQDDVRLTQDAAVSKAPCCAVSGTRVHVVWTDLRDGNWEIYYMQDPTGNAVTEDDMVRHSNDVRFLPNPFRTLTTIHVGTGYGAGSVGIEIYDATGRLVRSFRPVPCALCPARTWDGTDELRRDLPAGVYFICIRSNGYTRTMPVVLIR